MEQFRSQRLRFKLAKLGMPSGCGILGEPTGNKEHSGRPDPRRGQRWENAGSRLSHKLFPSGVGPAVGGQAQLRESASFGKVSGKVRTFVVSIYASCVVYDRHVGAYICRDIAVPYVSVNKTRLYASTSRFKWSKQPRNYLTKCFFIKPFYFIIGSLRL